MVDATMLCFCCQEIFKKLAVCIEMHDPVKGEDRAYVEIAERGQEINHFHFLASVQASARNGCQICSMLCHNFETSGEKPKEQLNLKYRGDYWTQSGSIEFSWDGELTNGFTSFGIEREKGW